MVVAVASVIVLGSVAYAATHRSADAAKPKVVVTNTSTPAAGSDKTATTLKSTTPVQPAKPGAPAVPSADPKPPTGAGDVETPVDPDATDAPIDVAVAPTSNTERVRLLSEQAHLSGTITNGDGTGTSDIDLWYGPNGARREDRVVEGEPTSIVSSVITVNNVNYWNSNMVAGLGDRWLITPSNSAPSRADWFTETLGGWEGLIPSLLDDDDTDGIPTRHFAIVPRVSAGASAETAEIWVDADGMPRRIVVHTVDLSGKDSTIDVTASYDEEITIAVPKKIVTNDELEAAKKAPSGG
jgi:hypothetical protein